MLISVKIQGKVIKIIDSSASTNIYFVAESQTMTFAIFLQIIEDPSFPRTNNITTEMFSNFFKVLKPKNLTSVVGPFLEFYKS